MKRARSIEEMRFAASLEPCPSCGSSLVGDLAVSGQGGQWTLRGSCPSCAAPRSFTFTAIGNPTTTPVGRYDLGPLGSELITPDQFLEVWNEASGRVPSDPSKLSPALRARAADELTRALTAIFELTKLIPFGAAEVPGSSDPHLKRSWLKEEYMRLRVLVGKYTPARSVDRDTLAAHAAYVKAGAKGPGRLALVDRKLVGESYDSVDLTFAEIRRCDGTRIDFSDARLEHALLEQDTFTLAQLRSTVFTNAVIRGGTWTRIDASTARFNEAQIDGTDMSRSELEGSLWYDAKVTGARFDGSRFGNAVFDRATFQRCSFVGASFAKFSKSPEPTSAEAQFIDCDLRQTDWTNRDLGGTTFVRCKLGGALGKPASTSGLVLRDCGVDLPGFLAQLASS
ncbi:MAG TPA: pentapeptide repeat-containing protein [Kofleriaceae bacterium]|nr:pentapeptide repeat-containing protein [Kofleriaceae bacterium]